MMRYIKSKEWLASQLHDNHVRIVDCRFALHDSSSGKKEYEDGHLPGAVFFDLGDDLSGQVREHGGRHPLPDVDLFRKKLEQAGIDHGVTVVVYDGGEGSFAARFWWMLTYLGQSNVYILDGGFVEWKEANLPITTIVPKFEATQLEVNIQANMLASYEEVKARTADGQAVLVDSRARPRYLGLEEPLDARPGHIPGAINKVWTESFEHGKWKSKQEQAERFKDLPLTDHIIVYCGSGVTATPNILALLEAGYTNVKLYGGSYSDWVSYPDNPVGTGE